MGNALHMGEHKGGRGDNCLLSDINCVRLEPSMRCNVLGTVLTQITGISNVVCAQSLEKHTSYLSPK